MGRCAFRPITDYGAQQVETVNMQINRSDTCALLTNGRNRVGCFFSYVPGRYWCVMESEMNLRHDIDLVCQLRREETKEMRPYHGAISVARRTTSCSLQGSWKRSPQRRDVYQNESQFIAAAPLIHFASDRIGSGRVGSGRHSPYYT